MNKDEDVELLETPSTSTPMQNASTVDVPVVPSGMETNADGATSQSNSVHPNEASSESRVSPFVSKPNVVGTTANSPRISPDSIFVASPHTIKQQSAPKSSLKHPQNENVTDNSVSSSSPSSNTKSSKPILLIISFILLLGTVLVLPYSEDLFDKIFANNTEEVIDDVTVGDLVCTMDGDDLGNSYQYTETYSFDNGEIDSLEHKVLIQGEADYLNQRNVQCQQLQQTASSISGVTVDCDLSDEEMLETQFFNLARFDSANITTSFSEAGGVSPNAKNGDEYKEIKRVMEMSGYDCEVR